MPRALPDRRTLDLDPFELAYAQDGAGGDVVLLHGTLTALDDMMTVLGPFLREEARVTAFDRPGHGGSTRPAGDGSLSGQAKLLMDGFSRLGIEKPILVGHSAGGALALTMAIHYPERIAGVVALAPLAFYEPRLETMLFGPRGMPFLGPWMAQSWLRPSDAATLPLLWNAMFLPQAMPAAFADAMPFRALAGTGEMVTTGEDTLAMAVDLPNNLRHYWRCPVPVRVLAGDRDHVVNNALQGRLLARIMPDCTFAMAEGMGHMLHHFVPERVRDEVRILRGETNP